MSLYEKAVYSIYTDTEPPPLSHGTDILHGNMDSMTSPHPVSYSAVEKEQNVQ